MNTERISYEEVLEDSKILMDASNEMRNVFGEVERLISTLDSTWQSNAANQFAAKFNQLKAKFPMFYEAVQNYSTFLSNTVETYRAADAAVASSADSNLAS